MSLEKLIEQMNQFSENDNIFSISKKAEEVRAIFYQKLKQISKEDTVKESADLLFHLLVLWKAAGLRPEEIMAELSRRESISGLTEKNNRN